MFAANAEDGGHAPPYNFPDSLTRNESPLSARFHEYGHMLRVHAPKGHTVSSRRFQPTETGTMQRNADPERVYYLGRLSILEAEWANMDIIRTWGHD